jgi:hypothetical protein
MDLPSCFLCSAPVLELEGQFAKLDTYELQPTDEALKQRAWGWCHLVCLRGSPWATFWARRRRERYTEQQQLPVVGTTAMGTVVRREQNRESVIIGAEGSLLTLEDEQLAAAEPFPGGWRIPLVEKYGLDLDDTPLVARVQAVLQSVGSYPVSELISALGIEDKIHRPAVLADAVFRYDKELAGSWSETWLAAQAVYHVFVPDDLFALVKR